MLDFTISLNRHKLLIIHIIFLICLGTLTANEALLIPKYQAHPLLQKRIQKWIDRLENTPAKNMQYLIQLGEIATPQLHQALSKKDSKTKRKIIQIIVQIKNQSSIKALAKTLNDNQEDNRVREDAATAIGTFSAAQNIATFAHHALDKNTGISRATANTIFKLIKTKHDIKYLILLLKHKERDIVSKAHTKLVAMTGHNAPAKYQQWEIWYQQRN